MDTNTPHPKDENGEILLPIAYLPPLDYVACMMSAPKSIIELHETYPRQSWRNRCRIYTANGARNLIIPVERPAGNHSRTHEVRISNHVNWQKNHWKSLVSAYRNAPFFIFYSDLLAPFFLDPALSKGLLWEFNFRILKSVLEELSIEVNIGLSEKYRHNPEDQIDLRNELTPKTHRRKEALIGHWPHYHQTFAEKHGFIPNLSIADLMFNLGPESRDYLDDVSKHLQIYPKEG